MNESVLVEKENTIASIMLNEPNSLNALSLNLQKELLNSLIDLKDDVSTKVVVISGKGRAFCAGGNIKTMNLGKPLYQVKEQMDKASEIVKLIHNFNKPIIAAVHGYAAGAGFSIALASDFIVAEEDAKFSLAFKNIGLIPDLGAHYFLTNIVGPWKAKELIYRGAKITGVEGRDYGFINKVVPKGQVLEAAFELATELALGPTRAYTYSKSIINQSVYKTLDEIIELENYSQSLLRGTKDNREGIEAFLSKRFPEFSGE
ncbi:2-(1,2-epoxy-1,2-dihydrophenyl)acetyl-CoA isomerase [Neobacillus niacini]|uniref:enoyl-CoA hydratase/isomerase family protein n=1 Tax=Neobacillus niacini TaxID=86668 RepID=UPI00277EF7EF|nr:enoyl-CoA hydratase-related protein [Neobacillus niacini]MDQ1002227.1 2-(1,2-epoxy-1,2-dihydrophenyl)acetyl-CoA isomerase [Neobacillus niacini]